MKCINCGNNLSNDSAFCENCGTPVPKNIQNSGNTGMYCPQCGHPMEATDAFCAECGYNLSSSDNTHQFYSDGYRPQRTNSSAVRNILIIVLSLVAVGLLTCCVLIFTGVDLPLISDGNDSSITDTVKKSDKDKDKRDKDNRNKNKRDKDNRDKDDTKDNDRNQDNNDERNNERDDEQNNRDDEWSNEEHNPNNDNVPVDDTRYPDQQPMYMLPTDQRYISFQDLEGFSKDEVAIIRNEIYARHGYIFKTEPFISYFNSQEWYRPNPYFNESLFSAVEKANIDLIVAYEAANHWR